MSYFSRLTDIITCNLSAILAREPDPQAALPAIIAEMEEGLAGAKRSVGTAAAAVERLEKEIEEHLRQAHGWTEQAKQSLAIADEDEARLALLRKREVEDLIAGLDQQHAAAVNTRDHLTTTLRAIEARLADARRKQQELATGTAPKRSPAVSNTSGGSFTDDRARLIEEELQALKRELGQEL